jgi:hypothetical protein
VKDSVLPITTRPSTLLLVPWLVLTVAYGLLQGIKPDTSGYWVGVVSSATEFTIFSCSYAALSGALAASRVRRGKLQRLAPARSPLEIAWVSLWPALVGAAILQAVGLFVASSQSFGAPGGFPAEVLIAWAAMVLFHSVLGYGLGLLLPAVASAPLALLISYVWLGFTWAMSYIPLRYLSGLAISGCCIVDSSLAWQAPLAVTVFSVFGTVAIGFIIAGTLPTPRRVARTAAAMTFWASGTVLALSIASTLGSYPVSPRAAADLDCRNTNGIEICFFPEQRWQPTSNPDLDISGSITNLEQAGIPVPHRVSGELDNTRSDTISVVYRHDFTSSEIVHSLASSLVPQKIGEPGCARDQIDAGPTMLVSDTATAVLDALATGGGQPRPQEGTMEETVVAAQKVLALEPHSRDQWIHTAITALDTCGKLPAIPPGS